MWWECWPQAARLFRSEIYNDDKLVPILSNTHASTHERVCASVCVGVCVGVCFCVYGYIYICMYVEAQSAVGKYGKRKKYP